jgi:tetratricopeptide (TPR) repeat protein
VLTYEALIEHFMVPSLMLANWSERVRPVSNRSHSGEACLHAARLLPEKRAGSTRRLRGLLLKLGRSADAVGPWKVELAAHPPKHDDWLGYAELCLFLGDELEYRRARSELLMQFSATQEPPVAELTGRACLMMAGDDPELQQAVAFTERALAAGRPGHEFAYPYRLFAQGMARYRQGRFDEAIKLMTGEAGSVMGPSPRILTAMAQHQNGEHDRARETLAAAILSYDWSASKADNHNVWIAHILRREAEAMIQLNEPVVPE